MSAVIARRGALSGDLLDPVECWQPGDIVLDADRGLWCRAEQRDVAQGWPWAYAPSRAPRRQDNNIPEGAVAEKDPVRPLTLILRDGRPVHVNPTQP